MSKAPSENDLDALYSAPVAEFVARRNELAKALKAQGEAEAAGVIRKLTKPAISAWAVNRLALEHEEAFAELLAAGDAVREAQRTGDASSLREATAERKAAVSRLLELALEQVAGQGSAASEAVARRIRSTLDALAAWGSAHSPDPPPGRLEGDVEPPGFEVLMGVLPSGGPRRVPSEPATSGKPPARAKKSSEAPAAERASATQGSAKPKRDPEATAAQRAAARRAVEQAREGVQEASSRRARAGREEGGLRRQAERLSRTVRLAEERLERERSKLGEVEKELVRVKSAIERARFAEAQARAVLERAEKDLRELG
ncbi:MAG TPA: hypothetical protein VMT85_12000 [Thermoanaerobaculia bacterium]|nr:hypothetical protein [Thermoanaerobaculia bacterium]